MEEKDIHQVVRVLKDTASSWGGPAVSGAARGSCDPFKILISCLLSLRTKDKVTHQASNRLLSRAKDARSMVKLDVEEIQKIIYPVGFYKNKAQTIKKLADLLLEKTQGKVPSGLNELLSLPGVGRKTANLVLTLGFGKPGICVDTHVHRITNRWGYVRTKTPEQTEFALREKLPGRYWVNFNSLLVNFGQNICVPVSPFCSRCSVAKFCQRVGVTRKR